MIRYRQLGERGDRKARAGAAVLACAAALAAACSGGATSEPPPPCWEPFVQADPTAGVLEASTDAAQFKCRTASQEATAQYSVVVGNVRVQLLSSTLVRLEERGPGDFEDRCTFVVIDRGWPGVAHEVSKDGKDTLVKADGYTVRIPSEGASLSGAQVLGKDGKVLYAADGKPPQRTFLPGPSEPVGSWVMGDMPRLVPPEWGATPPPSPRTDSGWDTTNDAPDVYVFVPGEEGYAGLRSDFLKLTGPVELPPLYTFGLWFSRYYAYTEKTALDTVEGFRKRRIPLDLLVVDTDWRIGGSAGYAPDPQYFPDMAGFFPKAHDKHVRIMFNDHPEPTGPSLDPAELQFRWDGLTGLLEQGLDAWWYDRNWYTSLAEPVPGISKEVWGMRLYHDVAERFRPDSRPLIMSNVEGIDNGMLRQPSSPSAHRFSIWWTGDTRSTWGFLKLGIQNGVLSGLLSLLPYVNEDAGGHQGDPAPELYTRFMQFATLSPVARPHCTKGQKRLPWEFGPEAETIVTDYIRLRYRLLPMIYGAARRAYDDGTPLMRRLDLEWPEHAEATDATQYLLGDDLLVAPIHGNPAVAITSTDVKTPEGKPGFLGEYFTGMGLSGKPVVTRVDERIEFDWAYLSPADGIPSDGFSVRWTGVVGPAAATSEAIFAVTGDDGFRLWVDDKLVIDQWVDQAATEVTAKVKMEAGKTYTVRLEYYESGGNAICQLYWQPPGHLPPNVRSVWLPPGVWHDAWTGATSTGPATVQITSPLRHTPLYVRDGGIVPTIPQLEYTGAAVWPRTVLDVFVPAAEAPLRTERILYEDDGVSTRYRMGGHGRTPLVLERNECGARLVLGPTAGDFDGLPQTRTWVMRVHLPNGTAPEMLTVGGQEVALEPADAAAFQAELLAPAAGGLMPFAGEGMPPGPAGGPVLELVLHHHDVREAVEIRLKTRESVTDAPGGADARSRPAGTDTGASVDALGPEVEQEPETESPADAASFIDGGTGFACANFSVAGEVTPDAELFKRILYNPPVLGSWLEEWGSGRLVLETGSKRWTGPQCKKRKVLRSWPRAGMEWADSDLAVTLKVEAFAPVVGGDVAATALPVLVARLSLEGPADEPVALEFLLDRRGGDFTGPFTGEVDGAGRLDSVYGFGLGWNGMEKGDDSSLVVVDSNTVRSRVELTLPASGERSLDLLLLFWHPDARAAADYKDLPALFAGVRAKLAELDAATAAFPDLLPKSGDAGIDEYLRWYMTAGIMLTRVLKDDTTLTMGYAELNQRDSFWTSFVHLLLWPEAERRMIEESAAAVGDNGKVPTCILPVIEREDDIDINEYFLLRVARYYRQYGDKKLLESVFPQCEKALLYLVGRCGEGSALPEQQSFWADWKDVGAMTGRKYGPHFVLLYLAALKEMSFLARELGEDALADSWDALYAAAETQANLPVDEGGLWNGSHYVNVWNDGHKDGALLEDQVVAGAWGVIPPERFESIRKGLNEGNEQPWGVRDTFPYYPAETFGYEEGDYHNGAVWPWLNFADAIARCRYGHKDDALRILSEVAEWDLEKQGDFLPHENLHGETGKGIRHYVQGWNAAYLGAIVWGLNGKWPGG